MAGRERQYPDALLDALRERFEAGDDGCLLRVVYCCAFDRVPLPDWAADAFTMRYRFVTGLNARSWDDVFGKPVPPGVHLESARRKRRLFILATVHIDRMLRQEPRPSIDDGFFEALATALSEGTNGTVGTTYAKKIYYEYKALMGTLEHFREI